MAAAASEIEPAPSDRNISRQNSAPQLPVSTSSSSADQRWQSFNGASAAPAPGNPPPPGPYSGPPGAPLFKPAIPFSPPPPPPFAAQFPQRPPPPPDIAASSPRHGMSQPFSEIPISPSSGPPGLMNGQGEDRTKISPEDYATTFVMFTSRVILSEKKLLNATSLAFGALLSPGREIDPSPPAIQRDPSRCEKCGAYPNLYSRLTPVSGQWQCMLCQKINSSNGEYRPAGANDLHNWPELVSPVVDFMDAGSWRPGFVPVADSTVAAAPVVLVIDESLEEPLLQHLQSSLHSFLDSLGPSTRIGIITYGKTVSIYDLSETALAAADVIPGDVAPSQELLKMLIYGTGIYLTPIHTCLGVAHTIVSSLRPYSGNLREAARPRCLGTAVDVALALIQGPSTQIMAKRSSGNSHVLVCAAGPNTLGPGSLPQFENHPNYAYIEANSIKYMERLGRKARLSDTAVDVLCAGTCPVRAVTLEPLVKASGGVMVLHDDFGEAFGLNLQRSFTRAGGLRATLEVRCSEGIGVSSVIGPGQDASSDAAESFGREPAVALRMMSVEEHQGFALSMQLTSNFHDDYAYFQFVVRYTGTFQARITRVITVRLPVTTSVSKYLTGINPEAAAVLIAKRTALEAKSMADAAELRFSVDQRLKDIRSRFGPRAGAPPFPREITKLAEALFHLRRGPLLGSIVGHEDERLVIRNIFLQASYELALRMVLPRVYLFHDNGSFEAVPAYNLAMQSQTALILDHGTDVHIWLGHELCQDEKRNVVAFSACKEFVREITETRFPVPRMLTFKEGSSQARYLQARLIPAHDDPPYEQESRFPQLRELTQEQRARLKVKFVKTDEPSLTVWMKSLKL
ncbi:protein transport protein SEC23 [Selaginella moellendorffii]|nr:protein transport protein SEC23 [Selaginella moellendorffii]|eukprot:XP_002968157.2 protein transport protein SEC23 [Selaginella moellendorffii]